MGYGTRLWTLAAAVSIFSTGCAMTEWTKDLFVKRQARTALIGVVHVPFGFDRAELSPAPRGPSPRS